MGMIENDGKVSNIILNFIILYNNIKWIVMPEEIMDYAEKCAHEN